MRNNGELAKIDSARKELQLSAECPRLSLYSVVGEVEAVLKRFGVSNICSLWCDDVIYFQVEKKTPIAVCIIILVVKQILWWLHTVATIIILSLLYVFIKSPIIMIMNR